MMPSGSSVVARIEQDAARLQAVADPDRRGSRRSRPASRSATPIASSIRQDELDDRGGAAVIAGRDLRRRIGRIDDDGREAVPVEREREGEPDQAAAKDDDVRALHFLPLALPRCNAKRLTRESARAHEGEREHLGHIRWRQRQRANGRPGRLEQWREGSKRARPALGQLPRRARAQPCSPLFALVALVSYRPSDPSLNTAAGGPVRQLDGERRRLDRPTCC